MGVRLRFRLCEIIILMRDRESLTGESLRVHLRETLETSMKNSKQNQSSRWFILAFASVALAGLWW